jgi:hypothetical protein
MDDIETLMERAANLELSGATARKAGDETAADGFFHSALEFAVKAVDQSSAGGSLHVRLNVLRATARLSLDCGEVVEARRLIDEASDIDGFRDQRDEWAELRDPSSWPDGWLIAAVRRDPPDAAALDALVDRYCGDHPPLHRWTFDVRARGTKVYRVHNIAEPHPAPEANTGSESG